MQSEPAATDVPSFEQALSELERLVERQIAALEEALKTFERGVELTRHCQSALKVAQQKVDILLKRNGQPTAEAFIADDAAGSPHE